MSLDFGEIHERETVVSVTGKKGDFERIISDLSLDKQNGSGSRDTIYGKLTV